MILFHQQRDTMKILVTTCGFILSVSSILLAEELPKLTTLSQPEMRYETTPSKHVVLQRGDIRAVVVNNAGVNDNILPPHQSQYAGLGYLGHVIAPKNIFISNYGGMTPLIFWDGSNLTLRPMRETAVLPIQIRIINQFTVELYQAAGDTWGLENVRRYELLADGTLEITFEFIPHQPPPDRGGYLGVIYACYIDNAATSGINFYGLSRKGQKTPELVTQPSTGGHAIRSFLDGRTLKWDPKFHYRWLMEERPAMYTEPWYYGVSRGMALVQIFREQDQVGFTMEGGGGQAGRPGWGFEYFMRNYKPGKRFQVVMRLMYLPYKSPEQIRKAVVKNRKALGHVVK